MDANYEKYNNESLASYEIGQVEKDKVTFRLWTSLDQKNYIRLVTGELSNTTQINPGKPLKIIIHGYLSAASNDWVRQITKAYLSTVNANVIEVDWAEPASSVFYPNAAASTKSVAKHLSDLLLDLHKKFKILYPSIHVIGHSLGAHIGGFAGQTIQGEEKGGLGRISGLDPAGPLFSLVDPAERLSPDDANFVDVIHTDGNKFGYLDSLGDIDFYPNGGVAWQPGCYIYGVVEMSKCFLFVSFHYLHFLKISCGQ